MDINYEKLPDKIRARNDVLDGYSFFMEQIRKYHNVQKLPLDLAIEKAKEDTKISEIFKDFLNDKEFITVVMKIFTEEDRIELLSKEAMEKGMEKGILSVARNFLDVLSDNEIADRTGLPIETIQQLRHS